MKRTALNLLLSCTACAGPFAQSAEDLLKSGYAHLEKQEYAKAIADFEAALKIEPNDTVAKNGIATVKRRQGY